MMIAIEERPILNESDPKGHFVPHEAFE